MSDKTTKLVVCLNGGGPWGFRLQGGYGTGSPLVVSKVRRKSKSYRKLQEGDLVLSVNDQSCSCLTYDQVMEIADRTGNDLTLEVARHQCDKENTLPSQDFETILPRTSSPLKSAENVTRDVIFPIETTKKVISNTEISYTKKEEQTLSKSADDSTLSLDNMDLNDLIIATQKTLDCFTNDYKPSVIDTNISIQEVKNAETNFTSQSKTSDLKSTNLNSSTLLDGSYPFDLEKDVYASKDTLSRFQVNSSESSCTTVEDNLWLSSLTKKKKMFSSSSFYEEPGSLYPTVEEQVEMAKKIADSLADDTNRKSKGANMFYKRVKRSSKWIHEGPEQEEDESGGLGSLGFQDAEPGTPDVNTVPYRPSKGPPMLKLVLDQKQPMDLTALRSSGLAISEHNVVSPEVCHGIVKDLHSPIGKGAALFAKRKKKSEEWIVDENKVRAMLKEQERQIPTPPTSFDQFSNFGRPDVRLVRSPWEAAMSSPLGLPDAAFESRVRPDQLADSLIRAADSKRRLLSPPPSALYAAKPPRGWAATHDETDNLHLNQHLAPVSTQDYAAEISPSKKMVFQNFNTLPRLWKSNNR